VQEERGVDNPAVSPLLPCVMFQWGSAQEPVVQPGPPARLMIDATGFRSHAADPDSVVLGPSCSTTALFVRSSFTTSSLDIGVRLQARASRVTARVEHLWKPGRRIPGPPAVPSMTVRMSIPLPSKLQPGSALSFSSIKVFQTAQASYQQPHHRPSGVRACNLGESRGREHSHGPGKDGGPAHPKQHSAQPHRPDDLRQR